MTALFQSDIYIGYYLHTCVWSKAIVLQSQLSVLFCLIILGILCSHITIENIQNLSNKRFSDIIPVTCDSGYQLNGTSSIQCTESGKWANLPTCVGESPSTI